MGTHQTFPYKLGGKVNSLIHNVLTLRIFLNSEHFSICTSLLLLENHKILWCMKMQSYCVCARARTHVCVCVCTYTCMHLCLCMYECVYTCVYVCACMCIELCNLDCSHACIRLYFKHHSSMQCNWIYSHFSIGHRQAFKVCLNHWWHLPHSYS